MYLHVFCIFLCSGLGHYGVRGVNAVMSGVDQKVCLFLAVPCVLFTGSSARSTPEHGRTQHSWAGAGRVDEGAGVRLI